MRKVIAVVVGFAIIGAAYYFGTVKPIMESPKPTVSATKQIIGPIEFIFTDCRETAPRIVCVVETDSGWEIRDGWGVKSAKIPVPGGDPGGYVITYPVCSKPTEHNCVWLGGPNNTGTQHLNVNGETFPLVGRI